MTDPHNAAVTLGQLGGRSRSQAKIEAARKNAKLGGDRGGRPRKFDTIDQAREYARQVYRAVNAIVDGKRIRVLP